MLYNIKRRYMTNSCIFFRKSKLSKQAFGNNVSTPSWLYQFFKNTCGKSVFLLIFCLLEEKKLLYINKNITISVMIILYNLPEFFCYVNRDMYLNKEWDATLSNNTCIKSTFTILLFFIKYLQIKSKV